MSSIKVWIYCRTANSDGMALNNQRQQLIAYAQERHFEIAGITCESGSGLDFDRQGLKEVCAAAVAHRMNMLLTVNFDRIGRNVLQLLDYQKQLKESNVEHITIAGEKSSMFEAATYLRFTRKAMCNP